MVLAKIDQFVTRGWVALTMALLLWTVNLNLTVNDIVVTEILNW